LKYLQNKPEITRKELAELLELSQDGIEYHLDKLRNGKRIIHEGSTKKGRWKVLKKDLQCYKATRYLKVKLKDFAPKYADGEVMAD